jgi:hypothetical protein
MRTRQLAVVVATMSVALIGLAAPARADTRTYEVTITNLTGGQPFSPPVVATHVSGFRSFRIGKPASLGIQQIAENGNNGPMVAALQASPRVFDVAEAAAPLVPEGRPGAAMFDDTVTLTVEASDEARFVSFATMLVCTNDGFTGLRRVRMPSKVGNSRTFTTAGYDAGTEINTEDFADIVPPCQALIGVTSTDPGTGMTNPALAEGGVIHHHPGIAGGVDLVPAIPGWTDPVAEVSVERVS